MAVERFVLNQPWLDLTCHDYQELELEHLNLNVLELELELEKTWLVL